MLDSDQYKFSMQNAVCKLFPRAIVRYEFIDRNNTIYPNGFAKELRYIVKYFRDLTCTDEQMSWYENKCYYFDPVYINFLKGYKFDPNEVDIFQDDEGHLYVKIQGYWFRTILWETPLMGTISELYFKMIQPEIKSREERKENNIKKGKFFQSNSFPVIEMGTRRRYSYDNHLEVLEDQKGMLLGTSNPHFGHMLDMNIFGTIAHEFYMFHAATYGFKMANRMASENWAKVYEGALGIALTDTFTTDAFYKTFDLKFAKLNDGVRQDSDDPIEHLIKTYNFYKSMRIDPTTKTELFSDSIKDYETLNKLKNAIKQWPMRDAYGIGTWETNDVGAKPLNIVIKMTEAYLQEYKKWIKTIKLSDSASKNLGDSEQIKICKNELGIN
jgi:nicotinate phosphoribosyltransferase